MLNRDGVKKIYWSCHWLFSHVSRNVPEAKIITSHTGISLLSTSKRLKQHRPSECVEQLTAFDMTALLRLRDSHFITLV